ncbi:MAG: 2-(1,2-epoxy-1,2-dihydrophenyl)acetyl-CoA isomerase [Phycisphaerales bacterium]|nr:2-(1,2-epoxy-1,2-dihydrophenyl)acetyl-CoA isomerase [Phycisphaerales bacterium]
MPGIESVLLVENENAVRTLRLNRPDVLNAFNDDLLAALVKETKAAVRDDSVRCLVIAAAGRAFCSGQDLDTVKARMADPLAPELGQHLRNLYNPLIATIRTMEKPVIAAVNGVAAGAGCSLALACDLRVAAASASFIEVFINVGLVPDSGSTFTLPRLVGMGRAMEMVFTGRKVDADEALRIGLVNQVVPDDDLPAATIKLATKLASLPTRGIGLTKRAFNRSWTVDLDDQLEYEACLQTTAGKTADHAEGVRAFLEKRKPQFTGR